MRITPSRKKRSNPLPIAVRAHSLEDQESTESAIALEERVDGFELHVRAAFSNVGVSIG